MKIEKQQNKDEPITLRHLLYAALIASVDISRDSRRPETIFRECWQKALETTRIARNEK